MIYYEKITICINESMRTKILNYLHKILDSVSAEKMIKSLQSSPPLCIRTNTLKISPDELKTRLENLGFKLNEVESVRVLSQCLRSPCRFQRQLNILRVYSTFKVYHLCFQRLRYLPNLGNTFLTSPLLRVQKQRILPS
jgi:16S rRNA C967 or C1407 C5-methylase (RsmB/RsmF family)